MSLKTNIEADISALDENTKRSFHYHLDSFIREIAKLGIRHTVTHAAPPVIVDPAPVATKGEEHPASATPTGHHKP